MNTTKGSKGSITRTVSFSREAWQAIELNIPEGGNFSRFVCGCVIFALRDEKKVQAAQLNDLVIRANTISRALLKKELAFVPMA